MLGFHAALQGGDDQFFADVATESVRYNSTVIEGVVQPFESTRTPQTGGFAPDAVMRVDVKNSDMVTTGIKAGNRIEVKNAQGTWVSWLIDSIRPKTWTTALILIPSNGQKGMTAEF